jgi:hypothetical protein
VALKSAGSITVKSTCCMNPLSRWVSTPPRD